jgi:hypothetical protein
MKIELKLLDSDSSLAKQIFDAVKNILNSALNKSEQDIKTRVKQIISDSLRTEPEYQSLKSGILKAEFGIQFPETVDKIVEKLSDTLDIQQIPITTTNRGVKGGFRLVAIKSDNISGLTADLDAIVSDDIRGYKLPWLEWLLLRGADNIVKNYEVSFGPSPYSRSGMAIMKSSSGSWRVPPQFAGTAKSNWTTRAISKVENDIKNTIIQSIENNL